MFARSIAGLVIALLVSGTAAAEEHAKRFRVGDLIDLSMTGEVAAEYSRLAGTLGPVGTLRAGLKISTSARVSQVLENGHYRVEASTLHSKDQDKPRLLTLAATIDPGRIDSQTVRSKGWIYPSPNDLDNGVYVDQETEQHRVELSSLKDVKLRLWSLSEEVGD